jgi:HD superfamily phosphohydrolases
MKHVKDPIHGYIDIPSEELSIINTPEFQRLRRIKQLGLSDTVYPSATHTRFSHSLGVMYLAGELAKSVDVSEYTIRANKVAGLLHDIGHLPFSHTIEHLLEERTGMTHEDISCNYIDDLKRRDNVTFPVDTTDIKSIINGENNIVNTVSSRYCMLIG